MKKYLLTAPACLIAAVLLSPTVNAQTFKVAKFNIGGDVGSGWDTHGNGGKKIRASKRPSGAAPSKQTGSRVPQRLAGKAYEQ